MLAPNLERLLPTLWDRQFGTTDVLIVLPVSAISTRYVEHFGAEAERHAA